MAKVNMYPTSISQPNQNKSSGLAGIHFKEIRRDGKIHTKKLRDLDDPKYFHLWKNTSNLKSGKKANCGNRSSYHCSHATYYGIKGYRNTCPIAGVTGTYTQPAALKLQFNPSQKGISSTAIIKSVKVSFKHRCVGVDVENDKTSTSWGPNFSGFNHYPDRKVIKVKFAGQTQEWNKNPPLSSSKYDTVSLTFKSTSKNKIKYNDLAKKSIVIQYGNNLSTDPGNIYIKDLSIQVEYEEGKIYIEGSQTNKTIYMAESDNCRSLITCYIEAGYKNKNTKIEPSKAPKKFQNNKLSISHLKNIKDSDISKPYFPSKDGKTIAFDVVDTTGIEGKKQINCTLDGVGKISFEYTAVNRSKPVITIPSEIEKNTAPQGIVSIKATGGCTSRIEVYDEKYSPDKLLKTFEKFVSDGSNLIPQNDIDDFYSILSELDCGPHTLFFRRGDEPIDEMPSATIKISPTKYNIKLYEITKSSNGTITSKKELYGKFTTDQNKNSNKEILIEFVKTKELLNNPKFSIINPTYGSNGSRISTSSIDFIPNKNGGSTTLTIGTYFAGDYLLSIQEPENCSDKQTNLNIHINPTHKQHFDEVFVRGEDSTAFDYDYLVALEGDTIREPLYVETITLGASYKDIKICAPNHINATINNFSTLPIKVTNTSDKDIDNLFLELNTLIEDEYGALQVTTDEWVNEDGIFYNFVQKFNDYNKDILKVVNIKNLSPDKDNIEEEDVYIHIKKLYSKQTITFYIPIFSYAEKYINLQFLFFGEPLALYNTDDCYDDEKRFENIEIRVVDAILTDMKIFGDIDVLKPLKECPLECFYINGVTYSIKNIDSSDANYTETIIKNDPRLMLTKIEDKNENEIDINNSDLVKYENKIQNKSINLINSKILNKIKFGQDYPEITLKGYTDTKGYVTFYITIPQSIGQDYTINDLKDLCTISTELPDSSYEVINDFVVYSPGQIVPFKIRVFYIETFYVNQIYFYPNIHVAGAQDQITAYYKVCNLKNNEGILKTTFETNPDNYNLLENKVEEDILCGVPTSLDVFSKLEKVVVEQTQYNRLNLTIKNKNRFNKDIKIHINEIEENKYSYSNHYIEAGNIEFNNGEIIWKIDYLDKDTIIKGYIDFRGDILGLSNIEVEWEDFSSGTEFNVIQCECRKEENFTEE